MPVRKKRPIYTRIGRIKPLGKSRLIKKAKPRPWRPFKITSYRLRERLPRAEGLVIHRRPSGRPDIALDPRELRAVSLTKVRGTLPERIFYKELAKRRLIPGVFDFQSSLLGGRLQLGGIVADFLSQHWRLIVRIQGPTHKSRVGNLKDRQQLQLLADMGWTVYDLPDEIVYDMMALESWMRRHIDLHPSLGGRQVVGQTLFFASGEMNFAWTAQEHARITRLEDAVENVVRDMGRIEGRAVVTINGLSDIDSNLGLVQAGEFRVGNNKFPGDGFSGVRIGWPAFVYDSEEWHIAGINNDELQFGLRATDGVAIAGGGAVILSEYGIMFDISGTWGFPQDTIIWNDGPELVSTGNWSTLRGYIDFSLTETPNRVSILGMTLGRTTSGLSATDGYDEAQISFATQTKMGNGGQATFAMFTSHLAELDNRFAFDFTPGCGELLRLQGSRLSSPLGTVFINYDSRDVDLRVHGNNVDDIIKVDGSIDKGYYKGVEFAGLLDFDNTSGSQANSAAWYKVYEVVIPAGTLGADDGAYIEAFCSELNNSGGNRVIERRYTINGTNYTFAGDTQGSSASPRPDHGRLFITNQGSVSSQERWGYWENHSEVIQGTNAINTSTTALTISFWLRWTTAHANAIVYKRGGQAVIMRT